MSSAAVPHVVLVPFPGQGHINAFTSLAHVLAAAGVSVTLVHSTLTHSPSSPSSAHACKSDGASVRLEIMPDVASSVVGMDAFFSTDSAMCKGLEELLHKLMQEKNAPCCLVTDPLLPWCYDVACKFGLPTVGFWSSCAATVSVGFYIPELVAKGYIPAPDHEANKKTVVSFPGLSPIRIADLPADLRAENGLEGPEFELIRLSFENLRSADRILVNTVYEAEIKVFEAVRTEWKVSIDAVGPLHLISSMSSTGRPYSSLRQEDNSCLAWLDRQRESSVLYMSFGSVAAVEEDVFKELAHGLEASGESFLWVIRSDGHKDKAKTPEELLPEGFLARTVGRGRVIAWAPQVTVLRHPSVSAFLTHCGWNSLLESLCNGIPLLSFPQEAEQLINHKLVVDDWEVGLPLLVGDDPKVERSRVQAVMNAIMKGAEGTEVRNRAVKWREAAHKACHGSSKANLQKLVDDLKTGQFKRRF